MSSKSFTSLDLTRLQGIWQLIRLQNKAVGRPGCTTENKMYDLRIGTREEGPEFAERD